MDTERPTGRWRKPEPEIQNLPGTPASALEMLYARYGVIEVGEPAVRAKEDFERASQAR